MPSARQKLKSRRIHLDVWMKHSEKLTGYLYICQVIIIFQKIKHFSSLVQSYYNKAVVQGVIS